MNIIKWIKSLKVEITWTVAAGLAFFLVLPWVILFLYGKGATSTGIVAADFIADLGYRVFRIALVLLLGWGVFKWFFPTLENHVDQDDPSTDEAGSPLSFQTDWKKMSPNARNSLTVFAIIGILLSFSLLILFP
jgi:hypothetical protein